MRRIRFFGAIAVLGVCLLLGALATQAMAQDGAETQAKASKVSRLQAKVMTDEQLDQVTAGMPPPPTLLELGMFKITQGALMVGGGETFGGLHYIKRGTIKIIMFAD